jgi:predicted DNA-binding protein
MKPDNNLSNARKVVSPELWKRMKLQAVERGITLAEIINEAFEEYLERKEAKL